MTNEILFAKLQNDVIIPSKEYHNAGYDVYANFKEDEIIIKSHETKMIPTGLISAFSEDYVAVLHERGSTGSKGIGQRCGVIDSSYRGEWFVPLTNHNDKRLVISKKTDKVINNINEIIYPYSKAICQALMIEVPKLKIREVSAEFIRGISSERGEGSLGSSNK